MFVYPKMNPGFTIKTIPKTMKATFIRSMIRTGSFINNLAKNTVKIGDAAVMSAVSAKGSFWKKTARFRFVVCTLWTVNDVKDPLEGSLKLLCVRGRDRREALNLERPLKSFKFKFEGPSFPGELRISL